MDSRTQNQPVFIREHGKKIPLNFTSNTLATEQLFEVPMGMFTVAGYTPTDGYKVGKPKPKVTQKDREDFTPRELAFLNKLKRRVFFISATLTREFKGARYFVKKVRTQEDWMAKKEDQKTARKAKEK